MASKLSRHIRSTALWGCLFLGLGMSAGAAVPDTVALAPVSFKAAHAEIRIDYWQARQNTITQLLAMSEDLSKVKLVFIGDSITDFWSLDENPWAPGKFCGLQVWNQSFAGAPAKNLALNLGISGDRTEHILYRLKPSVSGGLGELDRTDLNPDFIIILAGINNSYNAEQPAAESIFAGVKAIIRSVHERKPKAIIVLQSLLPTGDADRNSNVVAPVNANLAELSRSAEFSPYVDFFDLHAAFVDSSGQQIAADFNDNLHPSKRGYEVWRDVLVSRLDSLRAKARATASSSQ